jgi:H+-transporting ATPase
MAILLAIQFINATIGWYETVKAADAVAALKKSLKPLATVKRDGTWANIDAGLVVPGDLVLLASGSAVPADCIVNEGNIDCDQSALTGESLPVTLKKGFPAQMGSTVVRGEVNATVQHTGKDTFFGRTAMLLNQGESLGNLQKVLLKIVLTLSALSITLCLIVLVYLLVHGKEPIREVLSFVVVLLVASIPIAIEIVSTTTLALGSRALSKQGAIVSKLTAIEEMAGMNMLCSDKTGTLTLNKMVIQDDCPTWVDGWDMKRTLQAAAMAAKWWEPPRDALDTMTLGAADIEALKPYAHLDFMPFDPMVKRTEATIEGPEGKFKVTKGATHIILELCSNKDAIHHEVEAKVTEYGMRGIRCMAVARTEPKPELAAKDDWIFIGVLTFLDPPRFDTKETIEQAMEMGVDVKMVTGDNVLIARETARVLGMGTNISTTEGLPSMNEDGSVPNDLAKTHGEMIINSDGFAQVFPEHKYLIVEALRQAGFATGMTGDGVNDAPALKRADVGIAVSGATDAARAAADIVLTEPGLNTVVHAMIVARQIFRRINNFINYRVAATLQLLCFFFVAVFAFPPHNYQPADASLRLTEVQEEQPNQICVDGIWPNYFKVRDERGGERRREREARARARRLRRPAAASPPPRSPSRFGTARQRRGEREERVRGGRGETGARAARADPPPPFLFPSSSRSSCSCSSPCSTTAPSSPSGTTTSFPRRAPTSGT